MKREIFASMLLVLLSSSPSHSMSKAEALAAMYGLFLGHIDVCGLTVKQWHVTAMGRAISAAAQSAADRDRAVGFARQMQQ